MIILPRIFLSGTYIYSQENIFFFIILGMIDMLSIEKIGELLDKKDYYESLLGSGAIGLDPWCVDINVNGRIDVSVYGHAQKGHVFGSHSGDNIFTLANQLTLYRPSDSHISHILYELGRAQHYRNAGTTYIHDDPTHVAIPTEELINHYNAAIINSRA